MAGLMVIVRVTGAKALPQASVAVQVSVTVPPQAPAGMAEKVEGFDVPEIRHPPVLELVNVSELGAGNGSPQARVMGAGAVITGNVAGLMVIVLVTGVKALPQASVAVQVSVTVPPQASGGIAEKVDKLEFPLRRHPAAPPLVYGNLLGAGSAAPHARVRGAGAVMVGKVAGLTVIVRVTGANALPQASVAVQVSMMVPPQAPAGDCTDNVDRFEVPLIKHPPVSPLV